MNGTLSPCAGTVGATSLGHMNQIPRSTLVPAALLAGLCPLVGNSIYEDTTGSGVKILAEAAASQPVAAKISIVLYLVGFIALIVVLGVMAAAIARRTPALSGIVAVGGAAAVAIKLAEAQTGMALRETADAVDPGTAEALVAIDEAGFAVYGFLLALALGAAGLGLLRSGLVPAWLGWWAAVMGGLGVLTATVGIVVPDAYVPIPFLLLLVWLIALGIAGARRPFPQAAGPPAVVPATQ
jgi:hypothetical protein